MPTINPNALVIIDMGLGFMPASEGTRLNVEGCGELAVPGGERLVKPINKLTRVALETGAYVAGTRDAHKLGTAHFSDEPNYRNTWPVHCVEGTPGFEYHPDLMIADSPLVGHFLKGQKIATSPEDDDSYTGALAINEYGERLPDVMRQRGVRNVYLAGVALGDGDEYKLCVDSTAFDLLRDGFNVHVIEDAVEAVLPENRALCFRNLGKAGISLVTADEAIAAFHNR